MKQLTKSLVVLSVLLLPITGWCDNEEYTLDKNHTSVNWGISHFDFSKFYGKWVADGKLWFNKEKPQDSKVEAVIKVEDIITGNDKLNKHLKTEEFFDETKYPEAKFISDKIVAKNGKITEVHGNLTVRGVTKPVVLKVTSQKVGKNMMGKDTVGFSANTTVKRSDFGMKAYLPGLGDDVKLDIEVEANK
jgi:polyisoprenoid-binding protein YceI